MMDLSLKKNNKGSSIVVVLMTTMFVGLLATIILWISYTNYSMKVTDLKNKNNFYSAEMVLDQVRVGLQQEVSQAFEYAYNLSMQTYNKGEQKQREDGFKATYLNRLRQQLKLGNDDTKYDVAKITAFVEADVMAHGQLTSSKANKMMPYEDGLVLEGVHVEYTNDEGYLAIIDTDIRLTIPKMQFIEPSNLPQFYEYCIIANKQLNSSITGGNTEFIGSIYGGQEGININGSSKWEIKNAARIVTDKAVTIEGGNAKLTVDKNSTLWANSVDVTQGVVELKGKSYIADDLTIHGDGSKVMLEDSYYGYGNAKDKATGSSAILVNGTDTTVDMSRLQYLMLAGHAFIGSSKVSDGVNTNDDIMMGESLAIKSNQVAYLVPEECIGVRQGNLLVGKNPIKKEEYEEFQRLLGSDNTVAEVDLKKNISRLGRSLESYGASFKKVFSATGGTTLVYYYLVMDEQNANRYFEDYYKANKDSKVTKYFGRYADLVKVNKNYEDLNIVGNMLVDVTEKEGFISDTIAKDQVNQVGIDAKIDSFKDIFKGLTKKLVNSTEDLKPEEALPDKTVFDNLIHKNNLISFLNGRGEVELSTGGSSNLKAVIVNNVGLSATPYVYGTGSDSNIRLIIATGDVVVKKSFTGLIIAGGTVKVDQNVVQIENNEEQLKQVLGIEIEEVAGEKIYLVNKFFQDGDKYVLNSSTGAIGDGASKINIGEMVNFENWSKE